jgi:hypothetical protein
MPETLYERVTRWAASADADVDYPLLLDQIEFCNTFLFSDYKPTRRAKEFRFRLEDWLNSV